MAQAQNQPNPVNQNTAPPPSGINLLPEMAENEIKSGVYKKKINLFALILLGLVGLGFVGILIFQGALALQAGSIRRRSSDAEIRIQKNQIVEIKALATKEKLDKIEQLLTAAIPSSIFITEISKASATNQPIKVTSLSISQNGEAFVDGIAKDSNVLKQWVDNLTNQVAKEYFAKINSVTLTGNPSEGYRFSFKMTFLKKGVYEINGK